MHDMLACLIARMVSLGATLRECAELLHFSGYKVEVKVEVQRSVIIARSTHSINYILASTRGHRLF